MDTNTSERKTNGQNTRFRSGRRRGIPAEAGSCNPVDPSAAAAHGADSWMIFRSRGLFLAGSGRVRRICRPNFRQDVTAGGSKHFEMEGNGIRTVKQERGSGPENEIVPSSEGKTRITDRPTNPIENPKPFW